MEERKIQWTEIGEVYLNDGDKWRLLHKLRVPIHQTRLLRTTMTIEIILNNNLNDDVESDH